MEDGVFISRPTAPEKKNEEKELEESFNRMIIASEIVEKKENSKKEESDDDEENPKIPEENQLPSTARVEPLKSAVSPEYVKKVLRELDTLSTEQLKQVLEKIKVSTSGTKRQLRKKVATYYRKENMLLSRKVENFNSDKTFRYFDYLIAIDFECTCVEIIYNYPHEIIELPAVLINVKDMKIVSTFRTYVRPVVNPKLSQFCIEFTKISQETVDNAPFFRDALQLLFNWMRSFGLGEKGVRFAFVTDGPHDMWKFMQYQCILAGMKMPHMFRSFVNIKKLFRDRYHGIAKGNGKSGIENMLEKFELEFQGNKHSGLDDAMNIAYICLEMMKRKIELRINQKCVRKINKQMNYEEDEVDEHDEMPTNNADSFRRDFQLWMRKLPLKLHTVVRREFLNEEYLDCESCDEMTDEQNEKNSAQENERCRRMLEQMMDKEFEEIDRRILGNREPQLMEVNSENLSENTSSSMNEEFFGVLESDVESFGVGSEVETSRRPISSSSVCSLPTVNASNSFSNFMEPPRNSLATRRF